MSTSLRVAIVGGGLGGLAAAIALRQRGHLVEVFEASSAYGELGAAIGCPPNAVRILDSLGCDNERVKGVEYAGIQSFGHTGGAGLTAMFGDIRGKYGCEWRLCHRVDLHNELQVMAFQPQSDSKLGTAAKLHLDKRVMSCTAEDGSLTMSDGSTTEWDLIVIADGINSTLRSIVTCEDISVPPSSVASYRWLIDADKVAKDPELDWVIRNGPSGPRLVTSTSMRELRALFLYPCRDYQLVNAMGIHTDGRDQDNVGMNVVASREELKQTYYDFGPQFLHFLELAENVRLWQLRTVPNLPRWTNKKLCLLGDAAHAMLPTIGQGAAMAFEDAITLATLIPLGTKSEDIPHRLKAYEQLRKGRVEFIKTESLEQMVIPEKRALYYRDPEMQRSVMGFDAAAIAQEYFETHFR